MSLWSGVTVDADADMLMWWIHLGHETMIGIVCLATFKRCNILRHRRHEHYRQVSNIRRTLEGNKIIDHSYVVGASPVGAAPTTSSFST